MNSEPLNRLHDSLLRLRGKDRLGFKMVRRIRAIVFTPDHAHLGSGKGGYNEEYDFYDHHSPFLLSGAAGSDD